MSRKLELGEEVRIVGCSREDLNGLVGKVRQHQSNGKIQVQVGNKAYALHNKFVQRMAEAKAAAGETQADATVAVQECVAICVGYLDATIGKFSKQRADKAVVDALFGLLIQQNHQLGMQLSQLQEAFKLSGLSDA